MHFSIPRPPALKEDEFGRQLACFHGGFHIRYSETWEDVTCEACLSCRLPSGGVRMTEKDIHNTEFAITFSETNLRYLQGEPATPERDRLIARTEAHIAEFKRALAAGERIPYFGAYLGGPGL